MWLIIGWLEKAAGSRARLIRGVDKMGKQVGKKIGKRITKTITKLADQAIAEMSVYYHHYNRIEAVF